MKPRWNGVFPAITTQMHKDGELDLDATARHAEVLIASAVASRSICLVQLGHARRQSESTTYYRNCKPTETP